MAKNLAACQRLDRKLEKLKRQIRRTHNIKKLKGLNKKESRLIHKLNKCWG